MKAKLLEIVDYLKSIDRRDYIKALVFSVLMLYPIMIFAFGIGMMSVSAGLAIAMFTWSALATAAFWQICLCRRLEGILDGTMY